MKEFQSQRFPVKEIVLLATLGAGLIASEHIPELLKNKQPNLVNSDTFIDHTGKRCRKLPILTPNEIYANQITCYKEEPALPIFRMPQIKKLLPKNPVDL